MIKGKRNWATEIVSIAMGFFDKLLSKSVDDKTDKGITVRSTDSATMQTIMIDEKSIGLND